MKKYKIRIRETLEKEVIIFADSKKSALEQVQEKYRAAKEDKFVLTASDFTGVDFKLVNKEC